MRRTRVSFVAALLVALTVPLASAQEDPEQRIESLMSEALDHMAAGGGLVTRAKSEQGEAAERSRAQGNAAYDEAVTKYTTCLELLDRVAVPEESKDEIRRLVHYNTACARSMQGRADEALTAFGQALATGYSEFDHIGSDPELEPIRKEPRFVQLLERARAKLAEAERALGGDALSPDALFPYDFTVTTLDGQPLALADLRGKVVIVDYWGTWCPPCRAEIPHFVELKQEFGDRLAIVGMTFEGGKTDAATIAKVKAFAAEVKINYPLTMVSTDEELAKVPELDAYPTTLFIDKQGRVRAREVGYRDVEALRTLVRALDAEAAPAAPTTPAPDGGPLRPF